MQKMEKSKNYALPIAMMFCLFAMISFVTGFQNPFGVIVKNQFEVSNFMSQLGNFANFIAYAFMGIPAGIMLKKIGYKKTALWAIVVGFTGVLVMFLSGVIESFAIYLTGAFIAGFSMCMLNTVVNPMLNTLGGGGKKGNQLIQFGGACNSIAATIVPVLVGYLMGDVSKATIKDGNPALFIAMGIFALVFIVLSFVSIPEPYVEKDDNKKDAYGPMSFRHFRLGIIAIFVYVGVEVAIPSIANLYMTEPQELGGLGLSAAVAGTLVGTYWFLMFVGRLIGGVIGGKVSPKGMLGFVLGLAALFILLAILLPNDILVKMPVFRADISFGLESVPLPVMFLILCGLCTSVMWGGIFNLAVEGLGKYTAIASGIFMVMVCGGGIIPPVQGWIADLTSNYIASYWIIFAGIVYMLYYALIGSENVNKDIPVD